MKALQRFAAIVSVVLIVPASSAQELGDQALVDLGAAEAAGLIREGRITSTALVEAVLGRARELDSLNAYIVIAVEQAMEQAKRADQAITDGERVGRLHGVPIAIKDNIEVAGQQNTAGTPGLVGYVPTENAEVIQPLLDEGAIIIGKNNMHELAMGITSGNTHFGAVGNAWRNDYFAGGSSGGTAAAVAANIATAGLGSDTGGSVRIPASLNGIYGLRPTTGRYSQEGITPLSSTRDTAGPITKNVADLALLDAVITGRQEAVAAADTNDIRLGIPTNYYFEGLESDVEKTIRETLAGLTAAGIELVEVELPGLAELQQAASTPIRGYEGGPLLVEYLEARTNNFTTLSGLIDAISSPGVQQVFAGLESGESSVSEEAYQQAMTVDRPRLQQLYASTFRNNNIDAIIFPTTIATAKPIEGTDSEISVNGVQVPTFPTFIHNTSPGSLAGIPGVTLPAGLDSEGLPVGLGLDGPAGSDARLLAIALTLEEILDFQARP